MRMRQKIESIELVWEGFHLCECEVRRGQNESLHVAIDSQCKCFVGPKFPSYTRPSQSSTHLAQGENYTSPQISLTIPIRHHIRITRKWNLNIRLCSCWTWTDGHARFSIYPWRKIKNLIMAVRTIGGIGGIRILTRTRRVRLTNTRAVCKIILLQWPTSWLGASGGLTSHLCWYL